MVHPSDIRYNAINQRFWLQYQASSPAVFGTMDAHLIAPSDTSEDRAARHQLVPTHTWVNLTRSDTYLHGPFNFAVVKGCKTRNRIAQEHWDALKLKQSLFSNPLPRFHILLYLVHASRGVHLVVHDPIFITTTVPLGD
jgi:hypothetical protein